MEALKEDIEQGRLIGEVTKFKDAIIECAKRIKSCDETYQISSLPEARDQFKDLMGSFNDFMKSVDATQRTYLQLNSEVNRDLGEDGEPNEAARIEHLFEQTYNTHLQATPDQVLALDALHKIIDEPPVNRDEDIMVEEPEERQLPKDPITKTNIRIAVRSKQCKHIYDKQTIEEYISRKERAKSTRIACPVAGCVNKTLTRDDLEPDEETNNLIESMTGTQIK